MTRLILVDDHQLFRDGLRALLTRHRDLDVVAEAGDAREALERCERVEHDVALVDVTLPGPNGIALVRELRRRGHRRPVLVLTMYDQADIVIDAFSAGANGYALKAQSEAELLEAVRVTAAGGRYAAPQVAAALQAVPDGASPGGVLAALSPREREVFDLLVRGLSNAEISRQLFISVKTVETHRTRILHKLDVHSIGALVRLAARHGLIAA